jgi:transmembrane sensor
MTDDEIASQLQEEWMTEEIDVSSVDSNRLGNLKENIDRAIGRPKAGMQLFKRIGQIAAAILLPVFIVTTYYFYKETRQLSSEEMVVTTGKGERASIILPDGTNVALNSESRLAYTPKVYNKKERQIAFDGEGYFKVHKDADRPFLIDAKGLMVRVLGTVFDLKARKKGETAELMLEEGSVQFFSTRTRENVLLKRGNKAILDQKTGRITVLCEKNIENAAAWKHGHLKFYETQLSSVIKNIETNYKVNINMDDTLYSSDLFTGTLPATNLNEAILILRKSYHLDCYQRGNKIILFKSKNKEP